MPIDPSDHTLNALLDGELDAAEADALLQQMRVDPELRQRVGELRLTKDLVRHAFPAGEVPARAARPARHVRPVRAWQRATAVVAALAVGVAVGWAGRGAGPAADPALLASVAGDAVAHADAAHVVLHVGTVAVARSPAVLDRAEGILEAGRASGRPVSVEIVANGGGLELLREDTSAHAPRLQALLAAYPELVLVACGQTVQRLRESGAQVRLLPGTVTATSALDEIVLRMQQGWTYLRI